MTLGLPDHLVKRTLSYALARAAHWFALTCLAASLVAVILLSLSTTAATEAAQAATEAAQAATTAAATTPTPTQTAATIAALLLMATALIALSLRRTVTLTLTYLAVGAVATYLYTITVLGLPGVFPSSNVFLVTLPKLALVMVGGAGASARAGVLWSTTGFVLAEIVTVSAAARADVPYGADVFTVSTYLFLVSVLLLTAFVRRDRTVQVALHRAMQTDQTRLLRHELDQRTLALGQDTTLQQLVALARAHPGPLSANLAGSIRDALQTLRGTDWLTDADALSVEPSRGTDAWLTSEVYAAIERSRDRGLVVEVTGDRAALGRLGPAIDRELGLAVQQCLVNVILHSGIVAAEVVIESEPNSISLMVMDAGRGFTESETGADRLGLRQAVHRRIERLGGSVSVLTRPGAGTSVLLSVPVAPEEADEPVEPGEHAAPTATRPTATGPTNSGPTDTGQTATAPTDSAPTDTAPTDTPDPERVAQ
ncbi:ATP-binding protein [Cryobacterium cheniae]|uniref:ATP-binding protein n=1 Tax=Cryobacterium cheniae TaxID=1259262 RepID=A0A4R8XU94_9MICO|nr:ATP-binding protein [Cryobacterium cheniae]TFC82982.1 ATP-binding protein [Cryobacterium cheniae]